MSVGVRTKRVVAAFAELPPEVVCIQAKLAFHNARQNLLTAWFTMDYGLWFGFLLPGLMRSRSPIPLGGTSNHFRRDVVTDIGAWDPYNVTEDADLGVRIAARGYATAVIDSTTLEEAPTPTRSTGSGSARAGTRGICRAGWCTPGGRSRCGAISERSASCASRSFWRAPRSSPA